jgi:hypothetical protein
MSCRTAWTSGSTVGDGAAATTGAAAWVVAIGCVGGSDCADGCFAVAAGVGAIGLSVGVGSGAAVGSAVGGATTAACTGALEVDAGSGAVIRPARNPIPINETVSAARMAQMERPLRKGVIGGAGSDGLAATAPTGSGSATSSASTVSISATGSARAGGTGRTDGGRGGGLDVRSAGGGPAVDSVGRGGSRDGRLVDGFVASSFAGGWEGPGTARLSVGSASLSLSRPIGVDARTLRA